MFKSPAIPPPQSRSTSHYASAISSPIQSSPLDVQRFQSLWSIQSRFQRAMICALGLSTGGIWLASSSFDCNLIFIDFRTGQLTGVVNLESRFHITSILWISDSILYAGTSNGLLFVINYSPVSKYPVVMRSILKPFDAPITALALDPTGNFLAIGCSGDTFIFSQPTHGGLHVWDLVNHIPPPSEGRHGLITSLGFYGASMKGGHQLFIGHAKDGFCIWRGPDDYQRTPYGSDPAVCSIGSAAVSSDGGFIVIVTLEHSTVLYPLTQDGPAIHRQQILQKEENPGPRPIVPVAVVANNLVMRGTTSGTVSIVDLNNGPLAPIQNDPQEVIRALVTCGNKVVVGFSNIVGQGSQIGCYVDSTSLTTPLSKLEPDSDKPAFEVTIGELEQHAGIYYVWIGLWLGWLERMCKDTIMRLTTRLFALLQCSRTRRLVCFLWCFIAMLVLDPPELPGRTSKGFRARAKQSSFQTPATTTSVEFVRDSATQGGYPTLGYLLTYCGWFVVSRFMWWAAWLLACLVFLFGCILGGLVYTALAIPRIIHAVVTAAPPFISAVICEVLLAYSDVSICPRAD